MRAAQFAQILVFDIGRRLERIGRRRMPRREGEVLRLGTATGDSNSKADRGGPEMRRGGSYTQSEQKRQSFLQPGRKTASPRLSTPVCVQPIDR